ncbi:Group 4 capsule polysaccharide lipoprotein gfcB, YjbF [Roseovarius sp. EC-HK134]|uniref:Group 4 capsule polysaccharide lipoprotein gfcB, YjbF n=1 Tax=Roseovarius mucosus TaxID=215743 RepID=A0A1V0RNE9_9RHOB|nr:group 4 capsule polysaccharide lipoprotein gfcB, YjbF [Roseovarius mucosus]VVT15910.1 Group 4 capsule polysaccharide lipoprotein gfcB, YjbF [Roseovarius sp. EC-HK134]VVT16490.1 Group 4 capsule polysaccharide lipoprotein gfcB, YjbF [Roseovarius sp. EC-SD190]
MIAASLPRLSLLVCAMVLAGCTNQRSSENVFTVTKRLIEQRRAQPVTPDPKIVQAVATDALSRTTGPVLLYTLEDRKAVAVLRPIAENGAYQTWASYGSSERLSATTLNGVLVSTRGLGNDLMSSRVEPLLEVVSRREDGVATIQQRYLDGENQIVNLKSDCKITRGETEAVTSVAGSVQGVRMTAECWQANRSVVNSYLVDANGAVVQSRHWAGPTMGYSTIQRLR